LLAAGFLDGSVRLWDLVSSQTSVEKVHEGNVEQVSFSENGRWLLTKDTVGTGCLWRVGRDITRTVPHCQNRVGRIQFSDKALVDITGSKIRLWGLDANEPWGEPLLIETGIAAVGGVLPDPDSRWLVAYDFDEILLWRHHPQARKGTLTQLERTVRPELQLSPDGRWLAREVGWGIPITVWDLLAPVPQRFSLPIPKELHQLGKLLALYRLGAGTAMLAVWWRADGWKEIVAFVDPSSFNADKERAWFDLRPGVQVSYTALSPGEEVKAQSRKMITADGRWLISRESQTTTLSRLRRDELKRLACDTAGRNLTDGEWKRYFPGQDYSSTCPDLPGLARKPSPTR
jgi:WD40 repeat protein